MSHGGGRHHTCDKTCDRELKKALQITCKALIVLVAGRGFEPLTFGL